MRTDPILTAIDYATIERRAHRLRNEEMSRIFRALIDRLLSLGSRSQAARKVPALHPRSSSGAPTAARSADSQNVDRRSATAVTCA